MSESPPVDILVQGAHALARGHDLPEILDGLLSGIAAATGAGSGAILTADRTTGELGIVASVGLGAPAAAGLVAAVRNPAHAVARTYASAETGFDVLPAAPGGPALRSHLPLVVGPHGAEQVVGVLALAHDRPIEPALRPLVVGVADLAALAIARERVQLAGTGVGTGGLNRKP
jgi:GAF domain-containing protein